MLDTILKYLSLDDPLFNVATVLIAGVIGGELFAMIKLPKVTGWIATGILLRSLSLPGLDEATLPRYAPFNYFVLGYIAFTVGATLYFKNLRNSGLRIGTLLLCEAVITTTCVALILIGVGGFVGEMSTTPAILLAAIAVAGAPGTTVLVIQEARAAGILTRTLVASIGLIDMVAVGVFMCVSTFLADGTNWLDSLASVGVQFLVTFLVGASCAGLALLLTRTIVGPAFLGPTMVAVILGSWGAASQFGTAGGILACTFAGITVTNLRHDTVRSAEAYLHSIGGVLFACFFTFAGMKLDFTQVPAAAGLVAVYFIARLIGKSTSAFAAMSIARAPSSLRNYLGVALLPHGGVAVGLILLVQNDERFADYENVVTTVGLATLAINQLLGPSATRFALTRTGEDHKDRPRLLDFLQEHRITVGVKGNTMQDVVSTLAGHLYATTNMPLEKDEFVRLVMERENIETTYLGEGLMIPHAVIEGGEEITGVLGISPEGLDLPTPDGHPIHTALLLATPSTHRKQHLEVLAAFAKAITRDVNLREQLYHARSAAHAYQVLHADDAEDLNYFLEDAIDHFTGPDKS